MNKAYPVVWYSFRCVSCSWTTPGTYNPNNDPALEGTVPDTDCPKCGSHDGVREGAEIPPPADIAAVVVDINSGPYCWWGKKQ
jgi:hypothetical protein